MQTVVAGRAGRCSPGDLAGLWARGRRRCDARAAAKGEYLIIPHSHWEGAVFLTREEYLQVGLPNILQVLRMLKTYPEYHFVLDQACYVGPFLERYPEEAAAFRGFVKEDRLQVIGGTDCMPTLIPPAASRPSAKFSLARAASAGSWAWT